MTIIDSFVSNYQRNLPTYMEICNEVESSLNQLVNDAGIMAIVSARVKDPKRLKLKLLNRNSKTNYSSHEDIISDIPDLIGARIALYFPNDKDRIQSILSRAFIIEKIKIFPSEQRKYEGYIRRFPGYCATHYRVHLKSSLGSRLNNPLIEIQAASLLMHAWSEVEHDLAYKTLKGKVSFDEYESLDEINGLVIAGELSLQRLQRLSQARIESGDKTITNHYQLSAYLFDKVYIVTKKRDIDLGDVETLYHILSKKHRLTRKKLDNDLAKIDFASEIPIAQQLADYYANTSIIDTTNIINNKARKNTSEGIHINDTQLGAFLRKWISLEKKILEIEKQSSYWQGSQEKTHLLRSKPDILPQQLADKYMSAKRFRNNLVHGSYIPTSVEIAKFEKIIDEVLNTLD